MRFSELDESLYKYSNEDLGFDQVLFEFKIGTEDINDISSNYIEPISDVSRHIVKSAKNMVKPLVDKVESVYNSYKEKRYIKSKIEDILRTNDTLDKLLSNDLIKVVLTKVDTEYYVKVKGKSDERIRNFFINHQLNKDGNKEFENFKDILHDEVPKLIRKAKKEFKLNIANESVNRIFNAFEEIYGLDELNKLKDRLK